MYWIRKQLILLLAVCLVYSGYFFAHLPVPQNTSAVLGTASNLSLFIEPTSGTAPIVSAIDASQKEVNIEVYLLSDPDIIDSLLTACQRGVTVRVMLEEHPFGGGNINTKTQQQLQNSCIQLEWTSPSFALTHEKTITIDRAETFILNQNLTSSAFGKNREYDIIDSNPTDVAEINAIFTADWLRHSYGPPASNIVVSPVNSRGMLSSLIAESKKSLWIETEVIDDPQIARLLVQKAASEEIHILLPTFTQIAANKRTAKELASAGITVKTMGSPYIHAKLILADETKAYVGSVNLTTQSMDENREVGIILSQPDIVSRLSESFLTDWQKATPESF